MVLTQKEIEQFKKLPTGNVCDANGKAVGDRDGVVVVAQEKVSEAPAGAQAIFDKEIKVREMLQQGKTSLEIYGFDAILQQKEKK